MEPVKSPGGVPPFGYQWNIAEKHLEVNKWERNIVLLIFKYALKDNLSPYNIAKSLNKYNLNSSRKGKLWTYKSVSYLFAPSRIDFYAGYQHDQKGSWEPIITSSMAAELKKKNIVTKTGSRPHKNKYLLTGGIAHCGYCQGHIKSAYYKSAASINAYYYCSTRSVYGKDKCPDSKTIIQGIADNIVIQTIKAQVQNLNNIQKWTAKYYSQQARDISSKVNEIDTKISSLLKGLNSIKSIDGVSKANKEIADLLAQKEKLLNLKLDRFDFNKLLAARNIEKKNIDQQKELLSSIIKKLDLFGDKIVIEFPFVISSQGSSKLEKEF